MNKCIRCVWHERCLYESVRGEIEEFKAAYPADYEKMRSNILEANIFEE